MKEAINEINNLQEEIMDDPDKFGEPREVEAAIHALELAKVRLEVLLRK